MNPLQGMFLAKSIAVLPLIPAMTDRRSTIPMSSVLSRSLQVVQGLCLTARLESVVPVASEDRGTTEMQLVTEESTVEVFV